MSDGTRWLFAGVPVRNGAGTDVVTLTLRTFEQASLTGTYLSDLGKVKSGWMSPAEFAGRWDGQHIGGVEVEGRADYAVEALRQAGPPPGVERYRKITGGPS